MRVGGKKKKKEKMRRENEAINNERIKEDRWRGMEKGGRRKIME